MTDNIAASITSSKPMKAWVYILGFLLPFSLALIFWVGLGTRTTASEESRSLVLLFVFFSLVPVSSLFLAAYISRVHRRLGQEGWPAFLLLIPFFNLLWQYVVIFPLGGLVSDEVKRRNLQNVKVGIGFSGLSCHVLIVAGLGSMFSFGTSDNPLLFYFTIILILLWVFIISVMLYDYSKVVNILISTPVVEFQPKTLIMQFETFDALSWPDKCSSCGLNFSGNATVESEVNIQRALSVPGKPKVLPVKLCEECGKKASKFKVIRNVGSVIVLLAFIGPIFLGIRAPNQMMGAAAIFWVGAILMFVAYSSSKKAIGLRCKRLSKNHWEFRFRNDAFQKEFHDQNSALLMLTEAIQQQTSDTAIRSAKQMATSSKLLKDRKRVFGWILMGLACLLIICMSPTWLEHLISAAKRLLTDVSLFGIAFFIYEIIITPGMLLALSIGLLFWGIKLVFKEEPIKE